MTGGIGIVGGAQAAPDGPGLGDLMDVAAFWAPVAAFMSCWPGGGSCAIDVTNPGDPAVVADFGGAAAPEGPQGEPVMVGIRARSSNLECADGD